ncbi:condensation domain-containing protein, partial [Streptomyces cacaoi]
MSRRPESLPLTAAQRGIWFATQNSASANVAFRVGEFVEITGPVDETAFDTALHRTVEEIDGLHVRFAAGDDGPVQIFRPDTERAWELTRVDLSSRRDPWSAARDWVTARMAQPLDPACDRLFDHALLTLSPDRHIWAYSYHHLVMDATGFALVATRVAEHYAALTEQRPCARSPFGSLSDVIRRERAYEESGQRAVDREFWTDRLAGWRPPRPLTAPTGRTGDGTVLRTPEAPLADAARLRAAAERAGVRWSRLVVAATAGYLHRLTGESDIVLGLPVTGRDSEETRHLPGSVSNVLPLRLSVPPGATFAQLAAQADTELRELRQHQGYHGEEILRDLGLAGEQGPLFSPNINILSFHRALRFGDSPCTFHPCHNSMGIGVSFMVWDRRDGSDPALGAEADPAYCAETDLTGHHGRLLRVLEAAIEDPDRRVDTVSLLDAAEREAALGRPTGEPPEEPHATLPELFRARVRSGPDAPAVSCGGRTLSYRELDVLSDRLAGVLVGRGVGPERLVALVLPRSVDLVVAVLGVLKAGGAYVPVDPEYPVARVAFLLGDACPALLVTDAATVSSLPSDAPGERLLLEEALAEPCPEKASHVGELVVRPDCPAYVIY